MATRVLDIRVEVPDTVPEDVTRAAAQGAKETLITGLQQQGQLTIREAAQALGLEYEEYLTLLAGKGLPVSRWTADDDVIDAVLHTIRERRDDPQ